MFAVSVLVIFGLLGLPRVVKANFVSFAPMGLSGVLQSAALLFFAYTGYARIATLGEEVTNPSVNIPRAILLALGGSSSLYLLVSYVLVGTVPADHLATGSPLETVAGLWGISWLGLLVAVAAITAMISVHLGQLLGISRMFFAMARDGYFPKFVRMVSPREAVPHTALLLTAGLVIILVSLAEFFSIISMASFAILIYYALANASALTLEPGHRVYSRTISWVGLIGCSILALSLTRTTIFTGLLVLVIGIGYYFVFDGRSVKK